MTGPSRAPRHLHTRRDGYGKLHIQRPDGTWITPVGCDPPTELDFQTDDDLDRITRQRLEDAVTERRGA